MASTNKTTNLDLSQYIATDKPTYLVDYNTDMQKIDTAVKEAEVVGNDNNISIGTLNSLTTTNKTDLVSSINEVNSKVIANGTNIATNTSDISNIKTNITSLQSSVTQNTADINNIINLLYPIGSIFLNVNDTNPATLFGGTWAQIKDRFLLATGDIYANGTIGGEATHTLTIDEMPKHSHQLFGYNGGVESGTGAPLLSAHNATWAKTDVLTESGSNGAHNNMPPYLAIYIWKRTA